MFVLAFVFALLSGGFGVAAYAKTKSLLVAVAVTALIICVVLQMTMHTGMSWST